MGAHRQSHRRSKRGCSSIEKLAAPKHYFTDRHNKYICLNFGIGPNVDAHKKVICGGCQKSLGNNLVLTDELRNKSNHERNDNRKFEQPWYIGNEDHREERKENAHRDFLALFDVEPEEYANADINNKSDLSQPPPKRRRRQTKQNDAVMEDSPAKTEDELSTPLPPPPPPIFDEEGHFTKDAMEVIRTQLLS